MRKFKKKKNVTRLSGPFNQFYTETGSAGSPPVGPTDHKMDFSETDPPNGGFNAFYVPLI